MADGSDRLTGQTFSSIEAIGRTTWNALANPPDRPFNPFLSYDFLHALEASNSVSPAAGWSPQHILVTNGERPLGVAPLYLKNHSQGEYVFDHHWADAYQRAGGRYYPKLLASIPFTPATGRRLLAQSDIERATIALALRSAAEELGISSLHVNFFEDEDREPLLNAGYLERHGVQYHWNNRNYATFDDFLESLSSRKRKSIRRERREACASGLSIRCLSGIDIEERHWDAFWLFYQDTGARKWGNPYLTRAFFRLIAEEMLDKVLLVVAERNNEIVAGALNFIGDDTLYGRYWGCLENHAFLHFELCYYQAIEYAIANNISRVEAGAQGEHKIARGYEPVLTRSAHWIGDINFHRAIADYLKCERRQIAEELKILTGLSPYRRDSSGGIL